MRQPVLERGIRTLIHPISIGAIILLLINDHWLRWYYPSWWTGKIGDFVWLLFAPFLVIVVLSHTMPRNKLNYIGPTAFISTGLVFILGNTNTGFHQVIIWLFHLLAGWQPVLVRDATDLLMLPGLIIGWNIWQKSTEPQPYKTANSHKRIIGWFVFTLGTLATLANQPSYPDYGVYCVLRQDKSLIALTGFEHWSEHGWFESTDGGLTWTKFDFTKIDATPSCQREFPPWAIKDPANKNIHWRIPASEKFIEQSLDAGKTWRKIYEFPTGEQVREFYYRPSPQDIGPQGRIVKTGGPYNGVVDEGTGNLIVSMGFEGVVVVLPAGTVRHVDVGPYTFVDIHRLPLQQRLRNELFLAVWLACLAISILSIPLWPLSRYRSFFVWSVIIGALFWLLIALLVDVTFYIYLLQALLVFIKGWLIYPLLALIAGFKIVHTGSRQLAVSILVTALTSAAMFLVPLLFWATGLIPAYFITVLLSIFMASLPLWYGYGQINAQRGKV